MRHFNIIKAAAIASALVTAAWVSLDIFYPEDDFRFCMSYTFCEPVDNQFADCLSVPPNSGDLTWTIIDSTGCVSDSVQCTLAMPFDMVGCIGDLPSTDTFLVSGLEKTGPSSGFGVLAVVLLNRTTPGTISITHTQTYTEIDPFAFFHNRTENRLYVNDYSNGRILWAAWDGSGNPPPQDDFVELTTNGALRVLIPQVDPELVNLAYGSLNSPDLFDPSGPGTTADSPGVSVRILTSEGDGDDTIVVRFDGNGSPTVLSDGTSQPDLQGGDAAVLDTFYAGSYDAISVMLNATAGSVDLVDTTLAQTIGSISVSSVDTWTPMGPFPHILRYPGHLYEAVKGGESEGTTFVGFARYGHPVTTPTFGSDKGFFAASSMYVGNNAASIAGSIVSATELSTGTHVGQLLIGFRQSDDPVVDPVSEIAPDTYVLQYDGLLDFTLTPDPDSDELTFGVDLAIPDDPELDGIVVLFQFLITSPGGDVVVSDVFGSRVFAAIAEPNELQTSTTASTSTKNKAAATRWCQLEQIAPTPSKRLRARTALMALIQRLQK